MFPKKKTYVLVISKVTRYGNEKEYRKIIIFAFIQHSDSNLFLVHFGCDRSHSFILA